LAVSKISKPGNLNPMLEKKPIESKLKMSLAKSKLSIGLYDLDYNLIKTFINQIELAKYFNLNKSNIGMVYI
jgi:hypothetical protein